MKIVGWRPLKAAIYRTRSELFGSVQYPRQLGIRRGVRPSLPTTAASNREVSEGATFRRREYELGADRSVGLLLQTLEVIEGEKNC